MSPNKLFNKLSGYVSDRRPLEGFLNSLRELSANKNQRSALLAICEGNVIVTGGFLHEGILMRRAFP